MRNAARCGRGSLRKLRYSGWHRVFRDGPASSSKKEAGTSQGYRCRRSLPTNRQSTGTCQQRVDTRTRELLLPSDRFHHVRRGYYTGRACPSNLEEELRRGRAGLSYCRSDHWRNCRGRSNRISGVFHEVRQAPVRVIKALMSAPVLEDPSTRLFCPGYYRRFD